MYVYRFYIEAKQNSPIYISVTELEYSYSELKYC